VYSGEDALETVHRDGAEVMVLDLKMPGIDGFQVLREIKKSKPDIEVIILTGHGTEKDKETCMELGAFAYLQKPADIDLLAETMKQAYEKINLKKELAGGNAGEDSTTK
jgi:DNA-binding NtrC family response regulator